MLRLVETDGVFGARYGAYVEASRNVCGTPGVPGTGGTTKA